MEIEQQINKLEDELYNITKIKEKELKRSLVQAYKNIFPYIKKQEKLILNDITLYYRKKMSFKRFRWVDKDRDKFFKIPFLGTIHINDGRDVTYSLKPKYSDLGAPMVGLEYYGKKEIQHIYSPWDERFAEGIDTYIDNIPNFAIRYIIPVFFYLSKSITIDKNDIICDNPSGKILVHYTHTKIDLQSLIKDSLENDEISKKKVESLEKIPYFIQEHLKLVEKKNEEKANDLKNKIDSFKSV